MTIKRVYPAMIYHSLVPLLALTLVLTACGKTEPTPPPPTPTFTMKIGISDASGEGNMAKLREGESAAIGIDIEPYQQLDWTWEVTGTSKGTLNTNQGDNVIYTAGKAGIDTVIARAKLADGTGVKQSVDIEVEPPAPPTPTQTVTPLPPKVTLDSLQDKQKVPCSNLVSGTYPDGMDKAIWPVVFIGNVYHPQDEGGKAAQKANGEWFQTIRFGDCLNAPQKDAGQAFQLIIVTANEAANAAFEAYIANGKKTGKWPGMPQLPAGSEEQVRIVVIRE